MKMKKVTRSRWAILVFMTACLVAIITMSGCSVLEDQMLKAKGLMGMEAPVCDLSCEEEMK